MEIIQGLQSSTGKWVTLAKWDAADSDYDAMGWIEMMALTSAPNAASIPGGTVIYPERFDAFRSVDADA